MTCANLYPVQKSSPYNARPSSWDEHDDAGHMVVDDDDGTEYREIGEEGISEHMLPNAVARVRVVCCHGLTSYRCGGGSLAARLLEEEAKPGYFESGGKGWLLNHGRARKEEQTVSTVEDGFRSRVLAKGIVALSWAEKKTRAQEDGYGNGQEGDREGVSLVDLARRELVELERERQGNDGGCPMS